MNKNYEAMTTKELSGLIEFSNKNVLERGIVLNVLLKRLKAEGKI